MKTKKILNLIQNECKYTMHCKNCKFCVEGDNYCLFYKMPSEWNIDEIKKRLSEVNKWD